MDPFLARTHTFLRNYDEAERLNREYLSYLESIGKGSERQAILANDGIASNYMNSGRPAQAQPYYERVIELMVAMGRESGPYFVTVQANLGASFANQGQFEKARPILEAAFERRLELFGPNAYDVMNHRHDMAGLYWELGEHDKAIATAKQAWKDRSSNLGDQARETLESWHRYAEMLVNAGFEEEGLAEAPKLLPYAHKVFGDSHAITNWCVEHAPSREAAIGMVAIMQDLETWEAERTLTLLPRGNDWHYHDLEDAPPEDWHQLEFDPASWPHGPAPLGYGESDIAHEISFGSDPDAKRASAYFRTTFRYAGDVLEKLRLRVRRDDGVIVWLNGVEVARHHLPPADQSEGTGFAQREVGGIEERLYYCIDLNPDALKSNNVITAVVHQCNGRSSDLVFDLSVEGLKPSSSVGD